MKNKKIASTWVYENTEDGPGTGNNLTDLDFLLQARSASNHTEEKTYGLWGFIWKIIKWYDKRKVVHSFHKKTYLLLLIFVGWLGAHRWYQGRKYLALIEVLFFWTGVPFILCFTDLLEVIPIKADGKGYIRL